MWRVTWAHPEFGQVLATCSFDRTAAVWEELSSDATVKGANSTNTWIKRTSLVDSRTSVTDVRFAPKHLGLQLVRRFEWTMEGDTCSKIKMNVLEEF